MIKHKELKVLLHSRKMSILTIENSDKDKARIVKELEESIYKLIENTCTIGRRIKLKDGTFGKVRKVHGFSVQLERASTDICTWFLIDELLS